MSKEQILDSIKMLSHSQGFYTKLYQNIKNNKKALKFLESQKFNDVVDLILFLEQ